MKTTNKQTHPKKNKDGLIRVVCNECGQRMLVVEVPKYHQNGTLLNCGEFSGIIPFDQYLKESKEFF